MFRRAILILACAAIISAGSTVRAEAPVLPVPLDPQASYILVDAASGLPLYEQNPDSRIFPASTTKVMTGLLAVESGDLNKVLTASKAAVFDIGKDGMNIGINPGEEVVLNDLVNAMLVRSANETANIIAEGLAPSRQAFVDKMNERARELGATGTHFANPCGSHDDNHYTTVRDMSLFARQAMTLPVFRDIVQKKEYTMPATNRHSKPYSIPATNKLFFYKFDTGLSLTGIKTGYTGEAGYNLVSSARRDADGMELICVVSNMKAAGADTNVYKNSRDLLNYGFSNWTPQQIARSEALFKEITLDGAKDETPLRLLLQSNVTAVLPTDRTRWNIRSVETVKEGITLPVSEGDVLGVVKYYQNDYLIGSTNLVAGNTVEPLPPKVTEKIATKFSFFSVHSRTLIAAVAGLILFFILLRFTLRRISRGRRFRRYRQF